MRTRVIPTEDPRAFALALEVMRAGGLVAFPTDTVYGLGALVSDPDSIARLYQVKGRQEDKAIPVLLSDPSELDRVASNPGPVARRLAGRFWPGPLTLVVPRHPGLPEILSPLATIGVRVPDHPAALGLLRLTGPLAVTSANLSGEPSASTAQEVLEQLSERIPLILDGGRTPGGVPSTVVDCTGAELKILRQGPVTEAELLRALSDQRD